MGRQMWQYAMLVGVADVIKCRIAFPRPYDVVDRPLADNSNALAAFDLTAADDSTGEFPNTFVEASTFDSNAFTQPDGTQFVGKFRSPSYFSHAHHLVREEFTFRHDIREQAVDSLPKGHETLVSIHVRRGDYLTHPRSLYVKPLDLLYYHDALSKFPRGTQYAVFSDDMEWCRHWFTNHNFHFVGTGNQWVDMCAIGMCDHHILSNCSFSFWAAWLDPKAGKTVITPDRQGVSHGE